MGIREELARIVWENANPGLSADEWFYSTATYRTVDAILARFTVVELPEHVIPQAATRPAWLASRPDGDRKYLVAADTDVVLALGVRMTPSESRELAAALLAAANLAEENA
ncbi:hypothetical protein ACQR3W_21655 [Rhodococcus ruber]|uniref:Putative Gp86 n=1 Tax=Rhodococcus ruber TaxID=1830 RepID=A0A098BML3_9NOCA|nr:hypothetical protein [Rhodococcus ruber]MCZ4506422.1 hypothetical protein [Rhodococcus ruber]MCZ4533708.1 hypothetical protein [Rhodococcus ruber]CDZ88956.1 putative Gp86 [Rhodococcus ruber]